jgi:hypothetical protein
MLMENEKRYLIFVIIPFEILPFFEVMLRILVKNGIYIGVALDEDLEKNRRGTGEEQGMSYRVLGCGQVGEGVAMGICLLWFRVV